MWSARQNGLIVLRNFVPLIIRCNFVVLLGFFSVAAYAVGGLAEQALVTDASTAPVTAVVIEMPASKTAAFKASVSKAEVSKLPHSDLSKAATSQGVSSSQYMNLILGLVVIIGFIFLVAWLLRRVGGVPTASAGAMKIVGGLSLGSRDRVVLLQVGEKQILVGASPGNISLIHAFDEPVIETASASTGSDFYQKLQASLNRSTKS